MKITQSLRVFADSCVRETAPAGAGSRRSVRPLVKKMQKAGALLLAVAAVLTANWAPSAKAQDTSGNFLMFNYNRQRQGWNSAEKILTPTNVASSAFGEAWNSPQFAAFGSKPAHLYAVPLYVSSVTLSGGTFAGQTMPVVYAGTTNGDVYAVCGQGTGNVPAGTILWTRHLGNPENSADNDIPRGVFSTPCIDLNATPPTIYVASDVSGTGWEAFALDITNGTILPNWPVPLNDTTVAPVLQNGPAKFGQSSAESQRGALNLSADGTQLYVAFGDYGDNTNGYLIVVNTGTPRVQSAFAGCPSGSGTASLPYAGMWAAGGPALDLAGNIYVTTGNCPVPNSLQADQITGYWGMSVLVFGPTTPLALIGTYSPWNYASMDINDVDLCGSGVEVLPDVPGANPHLITFGCKNGNVFLLDRDNLPGGTTIRPDPTIISSQDPSLLPPDIFSYYTNNKTTPNGAQGPLNVFGPYSENGNNVQYAKSRTTPAMFQAADGTTYVIVTGATKTAPGVQNVIPPCVARLTVVTSDTTTGHSYLKFNTNTDVEMTQEYLSPSSPIVTSNGSSNGIIWNMDANVYRSGELQGSQPYLVGVDVTTMETIFQSAVGTLHAGGKYNEPSSANGLVFAGTDRIQAFGVLSNVLSIAAGSTGQGTYIADTDFAGGTVATGSVTPDTSGVTNPAPQSVYQSCRTGNAFSYTIPNLGPGASYSVRLHFCDETSTATGQRKFNVAINNTAVLSNYDIYAMATLASVTNPVAGQFKGRAVAEPFDAVADSNGNITISFSAGSAGAPIVSGIQVSTIAGTFSNITITSPVANSDNPSPLPFGYFLPQQAASGALQATFDNGMQQYVLTFSDNLGKPGQHNILIDTTNPLNNPGIIAGPPSIPDGVYTLTLSSQDTNGDPPVTSEAVTNVTIDATPPTIAAPSGGFTPTTIVTTGGGTTAPLPDYTTQAVTNDNIGVASVTQSPPAGTVEPEGPVQVTVTDFDGAGNSASAPTFTVNIIDGRVRLIKPTIGSANRSPLAVNYSLPQAGATGQTLLKFVDSSSNEFDLVLDDAGGYTTQGAHSVSINTQNPTSSAGIASGPMIPDGTYTITLTSTDTLGDGAQSAPPVTGVIIDATPPVITAKPKLALSTTLLTVQGQNTATLTDFTTSDYVSATDNLSTPTVRQVPPGGNSVTLDSPTQPFTLVTLTATDEAGNTATLQIEVHVKSSQPLYAAPSISGSAVPGAGSDPEIPAGAVFTAYGTPSINDSGVVAYTASWTSPNPAGKGPVVKGAGIFVGATPQKLVSLLSPVPGLSGQSWLSFTDPVIDANGHVAFLATVGGKKIKTTTVAVTNGLSGSLQIAAQTGAVSPSTEGANYKSFATYLLRPGQLTLLATLAPGSGSPKVKGNNAIGVFQYTSSGGSQVLRQGQTLTPGALQKFTIFSSVVGSPGQGRNEDAAGANVSYVGTFPKGVQAVMQGSTVMAQSGTNKNLDPTLTGATWANFGPVAVNNAGTGMAFRANLTKGAGGITPKTASGIFLSENGGAFQLIAQTDATVPPLPPNSAVNPVFTKFLDPVMAADSTGIAFIGTIKGGEITAANNSGIWWKPTGLPLQLIAQTGVPQTQLSMRIGTEWKNFTSLALPGGGLGPLFAANLVAGKGGVNGTNNSGVWAWDTGGVVQPLVQKGVSGAAGDFQTVTSFTALAAAKNSPGVTRNFNNTNGLVVGVTFADKTTGVLELGIP